MLTFTAGLMMVIAGPSPSPKPAAPKPGAPKGADPCTDKYNSSVEICKNNLARCKATGSTPENCENRYNVCMSEANKAKEDCQKKK